MADLEIRRLVLPCTEAVFVSGDGPDVEAFRLTYLDRFPAYRYGTIYVHTHWADGRPHLVLHRWRRA